MSFDQKTRNLLQRTVTACRRILDTEFAAQRREIFGINDDGSTAPLETLAHLPDEDMQVARLLRQRLEHLAAGLVASGKKQSEALKESVGRLTREQAFTVLNRLAALRMAERREIVLECVRNGAQSEGFLLFLQSAGSAFGGTFQAYRTYLSLLCDELSLDLGSLFSRWDPMALLFPRKDALEAILGELNGSGSAASRDEITKEAFNDLWLEDETVGWIYQYYNDETERKKMRKESSAPRNSRELAVRNQFFTPRYVVEFLTDNTLGRIWYEMTQGNTTLKEQCRYLVRRPTEIFLASGETPPAENQEQNTKNKELSQEALLKQPVHIPHRPLKDPRTILMLDPACGSMHFGLYAFDLFEVIYQEAWELEQKLGSDALIRPTGMKSLHASFADKEAFLKVVPKLIIECNIHGVDIDPRAAQIAGLALWLRAQKTRQRLGLKPAERLAIKRSNIVCAEPMPGEKELLREFVESTFPLEERPIFQHLLEAVFDKMQLAGEAGSLLKIEEEIQTAIAEGRSRWKAGPRLTQGLLFGGPGSTAAQDELDLSGVTDEMFWERIEERIYAALQGYAEQAENRGGFQRRLFAEDAARGFAFIDVCRKRYDVALMNPPFGVPSLPALKWFRNAYPLANDSLYLAFVISMAKCLGSGGLQGLICDRTFTYKRAYEQFRRYVLGANYLSALIDLGWNVLDANVEVCICTFGGRPSNTLFLNAAESANKADSLLSLAGSHYLPLNNFEKYPRATFSYNLEGGAFSFNSAPLVSTTAFVAVGGVTPADSERVYRLRWEIPPRSRIGMMGDWVDVHNGGPFSPFYYHLCYVVRSDGGSWNTVLSKSTARVPAKDRYGNSGLTYGKRTDFMYAYVMQQGQVFSVEGQALFPLQQFGVWGTLAFANSEFYQDFINQICGQHKLSGYLNNAKCNLSQLSSVVGNYAQSAYTTLRAFDATNEVSPDFLASTQNGLMPPSFRQFAEREMDRYFNATHLVFELNEKLNREVSATFAHEFSPPNARIRGVDYYANLTNSSLSVQQIVHQHLSYCFGIVLGRWDIRYATGEQAAPELPDPFAPLPVCPPGQLQNAQGLPACPEDVPAAYPVRIPWDGILVDDPNHPLDIERRVREVIEIIWSEKVGGPAAEAIEHEACEILGVKSLRDYFRKPAGFFADHLKRYSKSRRQAPIYWPLSTASGSYTLWIYYHRLTPDTLFKAQQQFLEPKLKTVEEDIHRLRTMLANNEGGAKERTQLEKLETLSDELKEMHAEIEHWAKRWKPNLNDGVLITACPLWKLFRMPKWRNDLEACWKELERGDYDWAHLALSLWPERVRKVCQTDRSIAIAHGLESLCKIEAPKPKAPRGRKKNTPVETSLEEEKPML
jgi:hypothetical protein